MTTAVPGGVDLAQQLKDAAGRAIVEVPGWLVRNEHKRVVDERAGDRDALLLAARKLARKCLGFRRESHLRQQAIDFDGNARRRRASDLERERDVGVRRAIVEESEVLEDHAELPAQSGHIPSLERCGIHAAHANLASGGALFHEDHLEQRALAGAAGTREEHEFTLGHVHGYVVEGQPGPRVCLRHVDEPDHRRACSRSAMRSSTFSSPTLIRTKPSGMPISARCSLVRLAWELYRGSHTRDSVPPRLGACVQIVKRRMNRSAALPPPASSMASIPPNPSCCSHAASWSG